MKLSIRYLLFVVLEYLSNLQEIYLLAFLVVCAIILKAKL